MCSSIVLVIESVTHLFDQWPFSWGHKHPLVLQLSQQILPTISRASWKLETIFFLRWVEIQLPFHIDLEQALPWGLGEDRMLALDLDVVDATSTC